MGRLKKDLLWVGLTQYLGFILPILATPLVAKSVGIGVFANYTIALAYITFFMIFVDFGMNSAAVQIMTAAGLHEKRECAAAIFIIRLFSFAIGFAALVFYAKFFLKDDSVFLCILALSPMLIAVAINSIWFLQCSGLVRLSAWPNVFFRIASLPIIYYSVIDSDDVYIACFLLAIPSLLASIVNLIQSWKHGLRFSFPQKTIFLRVLKTGLAVLGTALSIQLYNTILVAYAATLVTKSDIANFSAADRVIKLFFPLLAPISSVLLPITSKGFLSNAGVSNLKKLSTAYFVISFFFGMTCFLFSDWIVYVLYGSEFDLAASMIRALCIFPILSSLTNCIGTHGLIASGNSRYYFYITLAMGFASILSLPSVLSVFGIAGLIYLVILIEFFVLVLLIFTVNRKLA